MRILEGASAESRAGGARERPKDDIAACTLHVDRPALVLARDIEPLGTALAEPGITGPDRGKM